MSEFKSFKKADLAKVARKVGISVRSKDTKQSLLDKIELFIEENPSKAKELIESASLEGEETATLVEPEEDDDDEEDDDEDDDEEEVVERVTVDDDEDDEQDKDYNAPPPINLKEYIVDPAIDLFENARSKLLDFSDRIGFTTLDYNDDVRETLSKTVTLNYLELLLEFLFFVYTYIPLVPVKDNDTVHQVFKDNIPQLQDLELPIPDFTALYDFTVLSVLGHWVIYALVVPLVASYYINFSRRVVVIQDEEDDEDVSFVVRLYKYDPFIFALSKVLIYYFIDLKGALTTLSPYTNILHAIKNHFFLHLGLYHQFISGLGSVPIVIGLANVAIGLYSQFEDF